MYPNNVLGLSIDAIFLNRKSDLDWLYKKGGASNINPEIWDEFENFIPENERSDLLTAYYKRVTSNDEKTKIEACKIWFKWEYSLIYFHEKNNDVPLAFNDLKKTLPISRIECHYFYNNLFFKNNNDNFILDNINKIKNIPIIITHGKYDLVCPVDNAYRLHKLLPHSDLRVITFGGHTRYETQMLNAKVDAINDLIDLSSTS